MAATARPILARADLERFDPQAPRRRGRYRVCCPLCGPGKPVDAAHRSLTVNDADGLWYCHRCALGGQLREHWPERERSADRRQRVTTWAAWAFGKPASSPPLGNFADPRAITRTRTRDPRPDREADAALWAELLAVAHDLEPALPPGLYGALLGARCIGAQLTAGERTLRLTAPPDLAADYAALRREYLEPHAPMVRLLLEQAAGELRGLR